MRFTAALFLVLLALSGRASAQLSPAEAIYFHAFYLESGLRDHQQALETYIKARKHAQQAKDAELEFRCTLAQARVLIELGRRDEALDLLQALKQQKPNDAQVALLLRKQQRGSDPEFDASVQRLVERLDIPDQAKGARRDLIGLRQRALPILAGYLEDRRLQIVTGITRVLVSGGWKPGLDAIHAALIQPQVLYKEEILRASGHLANLESLEFFQKLTKQLPVELHDALRDTIGNTSYHQVLDGKVDRHPVLARFMEFLSNTPSLREALWRANWPRQIEEKLDDFSRRALADSELPLDTLVHAVRSFARSISNFRQRGREGDHELLQGALARLFEGGEPDQVSQVIHTLHQCSSIPWSKALNTSAARFVRRTIARGDASNSAMRCLDEIMGSRQVGHLDLGLTFQLFEEFAERWRGNYEQPIARLRAHILRHPALYDADQKERATQLVSKHWRFRKERNERREWLDAVSAARLPAWEVFQAGARDEDPTVREIAYTAYRRFDAIEPAPQFPHLAEDLRAASNSQSLLRLVSRYPKALDGKVLDAWIRDRKLSIIRARQALGLLLKIDEERGIALASSWLESGKGERLGVARNELFQALEEKAAPHFLAAIRKRGRFGGVFPGTWVYGETLGRKIASSVPADARDQAYIKQVFRFLPASEQETILSEVLKDPDSPLLVPALQSCSGPMLPRIAPTLLDLIWSPNAQVSAAARKLLDTWRFQRETRALLKSEVEGGETLATARALASSEDPEKRRAAAFALGALHSSTVVKDLLKLVSDSDASVRAAAAKALESLVK